MIDLRTAASELGVERWTFVTFAPSHVRGSMKPLGFLNDPVAQRSMGDYSKLKT
jgi:hypothetical protein